MIPQSFIQELLSRLDIVEVIGKHVPLKKTGKNFIACCPFHKEKTPSFTVTPSKQIYKCFGCGVFGNAIGFTMAYEGLTYPEAVRVLAERLGMVVPEDATERKKVARARTLFDHMQAAADFYRKSLESAPQAKAYLKKRGITPETAARFCLGFAPDAWNALKDVLGPTLYESAELEESTGCGLVVCKDATHRYDRFRGRVMFPIRNRRGQVISFGARTLNGDEQPKYLNGPETPIYHKGTEIYGLFEAADAIRAKKRAIIVEGYMDVISLSQAGFAEAVAALGTSVTSEHVRRLLKVTDTVYFCFDGDGAGQKALRRGMTASLPVIADNQEVRFIVLPPEHDPDSLIKAKGPEAFEEAMKKSLPLSEYFAKTVSEGKDLMTPEGRGQFLDEAKPLVAMMREAPFLRAQLVGFLAMKARMSPDALEEAFGIAPKRVEPPMPELTKPRWRRGLTRPNTPIAPLPEAGNFASRILADFLSFPSLCSEFSSCVEEAFIGKDDTLSQQILEVWRAALAGEKPIGEPQVLLAMLEESPYYRSYKEIFSKEIVFMTPLAKARLETRAAFVRLEKERVSEKVRSLASEEPFDADAYRKWSERERELAEELKKIEADSTADIA